MKPIPAAILEDLRPLPFFDEAAFLAAHEQKPVTSIRMHTEKPFQFGYETSQVPWCNEGKYLATRPVFTLDPAFHAGAYYVQEASSMFLDYLFRAIFPERNGLRVLDLCAAPGGKTTLLSSALGRDSLLISNEVIRTRASILEENASRWGYMSNWVVSNDPRDLGRLKGYFDCMVVDAPCSGSGLFRKDEKAIDVWSEANVAMCSQRQQRILADVWPALKEEGVLIYATCSFSPAEDEEILDRLAEGFGAETISVDVPKEWGIVEVVSAQRKMTGYRFFPDKLKGEGFFIAALRKKEEESSLKSPRFKSANDKKAFAEAKHLINGDDWMCFKDRDEFFAINQQHEADMHLLKQFVFLRKPGLQLGTPSVKEWLPAHDIALSVDRSSAIPSIELDKMQALQFLKREDFGLPIAERGWFLVTYKSLGLGWIKSLGNRVNNYLPKHWRIRMDIEGMDWQ